MRKIFIIVTLLGGVLLILSACASPAPTTPAPSAPAPATPEPSIPVPVTPAPAAPVPATPAPAAPAPAAVQGTNEVFVTIPDKEFRPSVLTVLVGTKVNWISTHGEPETIYHTITSTTGLFHGTVTHGGAPFSYTFTERGTFNYYCKNFDGMVGTVIVK